MFEKYRNRVTQKGFTPYGILHKNSELVTNATWLQSVYYKPVIVKHIDSGLPQFNEQTDAILDAHFEQKSKYNITGDEVAYWLQFRPHTLLEHSEIAIGSYVSIPDSDGNRQTWLIVHISDDGEEKKCQVLLCNWTYKWITNGKLYQCLGCQRYASSYNSGSFEMDRTTSVDNMNGLWLPTNSDSDTLGYNQRIMISAGNRAIPLCWEITKVETVTPIGLTKFTVSQSVYDPTIDNASLGIADYYKSSIPVVSSDTVSTDTITITYNGRNPTVKVGGNAKIFTATAESGAVLSWTLIDGDNQYTTSTSDYTITVTDNVFKLKVIKDYSLVGKVLKIKVQDTNNHSGEVKCEVIS